MAKVAVIGAGVSGLASARYLSTRPDLYQFVVFEKNSVIGGTWAYTEKTGKDEFGLDVHSSMYKNMRTNLPKETMSFHDDYSYYNQFSHLPSFTGHEDVLRYLQGYSQHFNQHKYIKFNTLVKLVSPVNPSERNTGWYVSTVDLQQPEGGRKEDISQFDSVIVCSGHYSLPKVPSIRGQDAFEGRIMHSHDYRHPEDFSGLNVVMLGAGNSGLDIALDLSVHAKRITLSHRGKPLESPLPSNVSQALTIEILTENRAVFQNGESVPCDVLMLCTGYLYSFPFFESSFPLQIVNQRVTPLYKHIIHTVYPSLAFVGIPFTNNPFPFNSSQVQFFLATLEGTHQLPSQEIMEADMRQDYQRRLEMGMPHHHAHKMGDLQWAYVDELCDLAKITRTPRFVQEIFEKTKERRESNLCEYKRDNFVLLNEREWTINEYQPCIKKGK